MAATTTDAFHDESRFSDVESGFARRLPPIRGFETKPIVTLEAAVQSLENLISDVQQMLWTVKGRCTRPSDGLTVDESASIMIYTLEWAPAETSFYCHLNRDLRSEDRQKLSPWYLYLRLVISALSKLPVSSPRIIYRGIKLDLSSQYLEDTETIWWSFSSCTTSVGVLQNHIGQSGERTIFNIMCQSAVDISRHSFFPPEKEVLLYPARQFKVNSSLNAGGGLHIIELEETQPLFPLFRIPSTEKTSPVDTDQSINILLVGEQGVGKSTFLNAFVNYLSFPTMQQARSHRSVVLKPLSFLMLTDNTFEERLISFGGSNQHAVQSTVQRCQTYTFNHQQVNGKKLCLIDTPSFENNEDSNKIKHILDYINNLTHLNAVCFLLNPDASRLLNSFQSCFGQLLRHLGPNVHGNVIFCFTRARSIDFMPGKTASLLRTMFDSLSMNNIPFTRTNTFFYENESFRYLIADQNGIDFSREDEADYKMSWSASVNESNRLLNYIHRTLRPCLIVKK